MSYTPTNWIDGETPVNAENLNKLEQAVANFSDSGGGGGLSMTLLWENASPTSEFAEQTLAIDWTPYDIIEVDLGSVCIAFEAKVDRSVTPSAVLRANDVTVGGCYREVKLVDGGIYIDDARAHRGSAWAHDTNALKPFRIYGIKGVIE